MDFIQATLLLFIPFLWIDQFSFPIALGILINWWILYLNRSIEIRSTLATMLILQLYLPQIQKADPGLLAVIGVGILLVVSRRKFQRIRETLSHCPPAPVFFSFVFAIVLSTLVWLSMYISRTNHHDALVPDEGLLLLFGIACLWLALTWIDPLSPRRDGRHTPVNLVVSLNYRSPLDYISGLVAIFMFISVLVRGFSLMGEMHMKMQYQEDSDTDWVDLVARAESLSFQPLDYLIRSNALESPSLWKRPDSWVSIAKNYPENLVKEIDGPGYYWKILARGGRLNPDRKTTGQQAVALLIDSPRQILYVLYQDGFLEAAATDYQSFQFPPSEKPYVHAGLDSRGGILALTRHGKVLRRDFSGAIAEVAPAYIVDSTGIFTRITIDPITGFPWAMDMYGNIYRHPTSEGWKVDTRFLEVSRNDRFDFDIARDLCISPDGTLSLLTCYGEIWSASVEGGDLNGPIRATHYWPDYPVGQSINWNPKGYDLVDRFGGFYLSPYPTESEILEKEGTHLFPRSIPQRSPHIVDHVFLSDPRWLCLLDRDGRIHVNVKWKDIWAE